MYNGHPRGHIGRQVTADADDRATPSTMLSECQLPRLDSVSAKRKTAIVKDGLALEDGTADGETGNAGCSRECYRTALFFSLVSLSTR